MARAGDSTSEVRDTMTAEPATCAIWPPAVQIALADLRERPASVIMAEADQRGQYVDLVTPVRFAGDPADNFAVVRLLATAIEHGVPVEWSLASVVPWGTSTLVHLPPPTRALGSPAEDEAIEWRSGHKVGLCFYRYGPEFVQIRDIRNRAESYRVLIDKPDVSWFRPLTVAAELDELPDRSRTLLAELRRNRLALVEGGNFVLLPHRLRKFPIPYTDI